MIDILKILDAEIEIFMRGHTPRRSPTGKTKVKP